MHLSNREVYECSNTCINLFLKYSEQTNFVVFHVII